MAQGSRPRMPESPRGSRDVKGGLGPERSGRVSEDEEKEGSLVGSMRQSGMRGSRPEGMVGPCDVAAGPRGNGFPNLLLQECGWAQPDSSLLAENTGGWLTRPSAQTGTGSRSPKLWIPEQSTAASLWQSPRLISPLHNPDRVLILRVPIGLESHSEKNSFLGPIYVQRNTQIFSV